MSNLGLETETYHTLSILILVISIIAAMWSVRSSNSIAIRMKEIDVMRHCNERYSEAGRHRVKLFKKLYTDNNVHQREIDEFFRHYWGVQCDQYDYFRKGFLPFDVYQSWVYSRYIDFHNNNPLGSIDGGGWDNNPELKLSFRYGWDQVGRAISEHHSDFFSFISELITTMQQADNMTSDRRPRFVKNWIKSRLKATRR